MIKERVRNEKKKNEIVKKKKFFLKSKRNNITKQKAFLADISILIENNSTIF